MTLMNPGPVNVTDWVRDAQLRGDLCHREPEFSDLMWSIRKKLLQAFDIEEEYSAILITGSLGSSSEIFFGSRNISQSIFPFDLVANARLLSTSASVPSKSNIIVSIIIIFYKI